MLGMIDVGGGMRGVYGAGVMDYMLRHGIKVDYCIGVSAGSANIAAYMSGQEGRNYRYYMKYAFRPEYMGVKNYIRDRSFINLDYIYSDLSNSDGEDPLDYDAMMNSGIKFRVVATDAETGEPVYFGHKDISQDDYGIFKASCCVPVVNKAYEFHGGKYYDGGLSDPIPLRKAYEEGCDKVIVILTRPRDYYRETKSDRRFALLLKKENPVIARKLANRAWIYNDELDLAKKYEGMGKALIIAPKFLEESGTLKRDRKAQLSMYVRGYQDAAAIPGFLEREVIEFKR